MLATARRAPLGGLSPASFLRRYWQRKALLVRQAIPDFRGLISRTELFGLASRDDVESRLIIRDRSRWSLSTGPFRRSELEALPRRRWTLLVQGVNLHLDAADALLRRFAFISYARVDDLMVSYAAPGGGVGPHFDSYDVFLLQAEGRRRWRISSQRDLSLVPSLPLKILKRFKPQQEWVLKPGDMLYLPPSKAHDGIAIDACTTYSIGFRAPASQELGMAFLDWLRDRLALEGRYSDAGRRPAAEPARIDETMQARCRKMLAHIRWDGDTLAQFLGCYLTEPKPQIFFARPRRRLPRRDFASAAARRGVRLDARSQLLYDDRDAYLNGEIIAVPAEGACEIMQLANDRFIAAGTSRIGSSPLMYEWYCNGFIHLD
jgi:50S ribosomal protein L16 3-hydroxylase